MQPRYAEGYTKGIHDEDAAKILAHLLPIHAEAGLLRFGPRDRAAALLFWESWDDPAKDRLAGQFASYGKRRSLFAGGDEIGAWKQRLATAFRTWTADHGLFPDIDAAKAADYLAEELAAGAAFLVSAAAAELSRHFHQALVAKRAESVLKDLLGDTASPAFVRYEIARDWLAGFAINHPEALQDTPAELLAAVIDEAAVHSARGGFEQRAVKTLPLSFRAEGLRSSHPRVADSTLEIHYSEFLDRLDRLERTDAAAFRALAERKSQLTGVKRDEMRLDEFKPKVMSSFVRNRLIDEVYLPLIGDNLAKQLGTAGANTRTDRTIQQLRQLIEGLRAVPVQVDIKVVPVQDEKGSIEKIDAPDSPALEFKPEVNQG